VEVRVGDYALDNTNFLSLPTWSGTWMASHGGTARLPLDDDYRELRRQIWLATDVAFKVALEELAKKQAVLKNRTRPEDLPDFSEEEPSALAAGEPLPPPDPPEAMASLVRELSGVLRARELAAIARRRKARFTQEQRLVRYVNSEGLFGARAERPPVVDATTQAADGLPLRDFVALTRARSASFRPPRAGGGGPHPWRERLQPGAPPAAGSPQRPRAVRGPGGSGALRPGLRPMLLAQRKLVAADERMLEMGGTTASFEDRIGARVLAAPCQWSTTRPRRSSTACHFWAATRSTIRRVRARRRHSSSAATSRPLLAGRVPVRGS
jgi:hypothetical protein